MYSPYFGQRSYPQYAGSPSVQQTYPYAQTNYYANSIQVSAAAKPVEASNTKKTKVRKTNKTLVPQWNFPAPRARV